MCEHRGRPRAFNGRSFLAGIEDSAGASYERLREKLKTSDVKAQRQLHNSSPDGIRTHDLFLERDCWALTNFQNFQPV